MLVASENGAFEARFNFYTLYLYELEFGTDMIKDVFRESTVAEGANGASLVFEAVNWTAIAKAIWAGAKCADKRLPRFEDWASQDNGIDLFTAAGEVVAEINKELFRFGVAAAS